MTSSKISFINIIFLNRSCQTYDHQTKTAGTVYKDIYFIYLFIYLLLIILLLLLLLLFFIAIIIIIIIIIVIVIVVSYWRFLSFVYPRYFHFSLRRNRRKVTWLKVNKYLNCFISFATKDSSSEARN